MKKTFVLLALFISLVTMSTVVSAAPITFSNIEVTAIRNTSLVIQWDTDVAATGQIEYGLDTNYGSLTEVEGLSYWHPLEITGLTEGTTYHYRIRAKDYKGVETLSGDYTFTTRTTEELENIIKAARINNDLPKTYYVKPGGSNSNDGLSLETAWETPRHASITSDAGDTILIVDGTYTGFVFVGFGYENSKGGIPEAPITMKAYNGTPIIGAKIILSANYITIDGLEIYNPTSDKVIDARWVSGIKISNCDLYGTGVEADGGDGVYFRDVTYSIIENCNIHEASWNGIGIKPFSWHPSACNHIIVRNIEMPNAKHNGFDAQGDYITVDNIDVSNTGERLINIHNAEYWVVINSTFETPATAGMMSAFLLKDIFIMNNTIKGAPIMYLDYAVSTITNFIVYNNYVSGYPHYGISSLGGNNVIVEENEVYTDGDWGYNYRFFNGESATLRNEKVSPYKVKSEDGTIVTVEYTDGRTFSVNGAGEYTTYTFSSGTRAIEVVGSTSVGNISGTVTNAETVLGIEGATVSVEGTGKSAETSADGTYTIANVPVGTYTITCTAPPIYQDATQSNVAVNEGRTTQVNFTLTKETTPPTITAHSPTGTDVRIDTGISVTFSESMNKTSAEGAFSISPSVSGSFNWDGNKMIFAPDSELDHLTTYIVNVGTTVEDLAGNNLASLYSWQFTTKEQDLTPPAISNVAVSIITGSSAIITWTTDEHSTSQIEYGLTPSYGTSTTLNANSFTEHSQAITGLNPNTTYHFRVRSKDADNNEAVSGDYNFATSEETNLVACWKFDEGDGNIAYDLSGNDNHGIINGATWIIDEMGSALEFDGVDDYVDCGNVCNFERTDLFSLTAWIKTSYTGNEVIVGNGEASAPHTGYVMSVENSKFNLHLISTWAPINRIHVEETAIGTITDNVWHHVAATYDGSSSATGIKLYIDGEEIATTTVADSLSATITTSNPITIGRKTDGSWPLPFYGSIDSVHIYDRALSAAEITADYEAGLGDTTPPTITAHSPTGTDVGTVITATFSEPMSTSSAEDAFSVSPSVAGTFGWIGNAMTFTPGTDLSYETTYTVTIDTAASDLAGNHIESAYSWQFTTETAQDTTLPVISDVGASDATISTIGITWTTDEPATSQVEYGLNTGYGSSTTIDTNLVTTHHVTLTGLLSDTPYHYRAKSKDIADNLAVSGDYNFTTHPTTDTVGLWHFNEGDGITALDSSGNNNNGTIHGATWTEGKLGTALLFDGTNDYVSIPDSPSLNPADEITIEAWVKTGAIPQSGYRKIIAKPYTSRTSPYQQYALTLNYDHFVFELNTEGIKEMLSGTETLESNTWYHVAGTYDGSEMRIYVNGEPNGTLSKSGAVARYPTDVHIGAGIYSNAQTEYLDGTIDEVRILNIALSAEEIRADYEAGLGDSTPPTITAHSPTGTDVLVGTAITATFSEPMSTSSAEDAFSVSPSVSGTFGWIGNTMTFTAGMDLSYETTYTVTIDTAASDLAGNHIKSAYSWQFTTETAPDTTPPVISDVGASDATTSTIVITWTTDEPATSQVEYGLNTGYGSSTTIDTNLVTTHHVTLTGLLSDTPYHYRVKSKDVADNLAVSGDHISFTIPSAMDTVGEWHFDEGIGTTALDSSGNNNDGTIHGATWTTGKLDSALRFDGVNDYVSIPDSPSLNPADEITMEAWVKTGAIPQSGYRKIIAKPYTSYTSPWQQYALTLHDNQFVFELNAGGTKEGVTGTETLESNTWYHVAGTYDGAEMRIYVNGEPNGTLPKNGTIARYPTDVHIGAGIYSNAQTEYLDGTIDEVRILNIALSAEEIRADYEAGIGDTTPPTITAHSPTGTDVPVGTAITATFSESMSTSSAEDAFSVSPSVAGTFGWTGNAMTFTPGMDLRYETTYIVTIDTAAADLAGNHIKSAYSWQFTTETAPDTTPPVADAGPDQTVDNGTVVYFDGSGSTDNIGIRSYSWDFDASNGIQSDATGVTASHTYTELVSYIVTLTVTDTSGNTDTDTCMVTVNAPRKQMASQFGVNDTSGISGTYTLVPVNIVGVTNGPIQTIKFDILYDESVLNLNSNDPEPLQPGTLIGAGWWFMLGSNNHSITLSTAWKSLAIPDGSAGSVILLNFSVIGAPGATSYMDISEIEFANTGNELGTAPAENGTFSVLRLGTISGTIAYSCNKTAIAGAVVNLTKNGSLISSTTTDANGMYTFTDLEPGEYDVSVSKIHFWDNSTSVTVYIDQETVSDLMLLLRGDLNDNGEIADAADVNMMMQAFTGDIPGDKYFDLDEVDEIAGFGDVEMILKASIGELIL